MASDANASTSMSAASASHNLTRHLSARQLSEYENCMRLSAEGKISAKNAFALNLIDYLEGLVKGDDEFANFQLASSSLDAGAKIYAGRVDAVHREAYKVMAELGRGGGVEGDCDDASQENSDSEQAAAPQPPKRSRSNAHHHQQQQQRKSVDPARLARIRLKPSSLRFDLDPLFHQQAAAYDESAAWELRLNAARVADNNCEILLDSDVRLGLGDDVEDCPGAVAVEELRELPRHLSAALQRTVEGSDVLCEELSELRLPTALHHRNEDGDISVSEADDDDFQGENDDTVWLADLDAPVRSSVPVGASTPAAGIADFAGGLRRFLGLSSSSSFSEADCSGESATATSNRLLCLGAWWPGFEGPRRCLLKTDSPAGVSRPLSNSSPRGEDPTGGEEQLLQVCDVAKQDLAPSEPRRRRRRSAWEAAAQRRRDRLADALAADAAASTESASSAPGVPFAVGVRRSHRLAGQAAGDAAAGDQSVIARDSTYIAQSDERAVETSGATADTVVDAEAAATCDIDIDDNDILEDAAMEDSAEEVVSSTTADVEAATSALQLSPDGCCESSSAEAAASFADPFAHGLLEPPYKVQRLDLAYARTAKRVDARRLKRAMWQLVEPASSNSLTESSSNSSQSSSASFASLLEQLPKMPAAVGACSGELSVQLVFNCLLHLAGEQKLHLESQADLSDVLFSRDSNGLNSKETSPRSAN